ncbi:PI-PLC domain-containing protein [Candidatus Enterovibrio altilux]|uniref:hypothetical protein n=1 Tax=Candidatus Enterovibrio altilux TaxID=1927128 RepID=UPI001F33538B|nr:hypothetical protein [Candidatus Enterovibrio luxaltus]
MKKGLTSFSRYSEYEPRTLLWGECAGIWYDSFSDMTVDEVLFTELLNLGKKIAVASPELHGKDYKTLWKKLYYLPSFVLDSKNLILCTDIPEIAREYFNDT